MHQMSSVAGAGPQTSEYIWQPRPLNVWLAMTPYNNLQAHALHQIQERLVAQGCHPVREPGEQTGLGAVVHLAIGCGADLDEEVNPRYVYGRLPKPRGTVLMITAVDRLPAMDLFTLARSQLLRKAAHIGIIIEGDPGGTRVQRALWASMAGNYRLLEGNEHDIFDNLALRAQAHAGAERVTEHVGDDTSKVSWDEWSRSPVHSDIAEAARALGNAGIIEDKVVLDQYGSQQQANTVLRFLQRAALGEGMHSQLDPSLRIMGVSASGGGKINVNPDPMAGHIIPIAELTWSGYVRAIPQGAPLTYGIPSVETHENGMVYLASTLVNAGLVDSFTAFVRFLKDHFVRHDRIAIVPHSLQPTALAIEHFHRQPKEDGIKGGAPVEIVRPDPTRFPEIDFPCGTREAELHLLSALFRAESFRRPGDRKVVVMAVLPGHGTVAVYNGPRRELIEILTTSVEMTRVTGI